MKRALIVTVWMVATVGSVGVCGAGDLAEVRERGELIMIAFPHQDSEFVAVDLSTGPMPKLGSPEHFVGVDVDVMARFAETLGVDLRIRPVAVPSYGELIPALLTGEGDVIASSFTITDARRERVDFSRPYFETHPVVIVRKGSGIDSVEDLEGATAATVPGSSQEQRLRRLGFSDDRLARISFTRQAYLAVAEGEADIALVDSGSMGTLLDELPSLEIGFHVDDQEEYGYAVRPDSDLLEPLDVLLRELEESGELQRILERHDAGRGSDD